MGIFDSLFSGMDTRTKLTPQESFAGILLAASACDGHIAEDEFNQILISLFRMKLFQRINENEFRKVLNKLMGFLKKNGPEKLAEGCCENLPAELRKSAFANACNIALADGHLDSDEKDFLTNLTNLLSLDTTEAKLIAQVIMIKNKG